MNLPTHYCETCNAEWHLGDEGGEDLKGNSKPSVSTYKDVFKLCFCCTLQHRLEHAEHCLVMIMPV